MDLISRSPNKTTTLQKIVSGLDYTQGSVILFLQEIERAGFIKTSNNGRIVELQTTNWWVPFTDYIRSNK